MIVNLNDHPKILRNDGGNANNWVDPAHPGAEPNYPNGASAATVARVQEEYNRNLKDFNTYVDIRNQLRQQILAAIDPTYLCSLQDPLYGYANLTPHEILEHLDVTYGRLNQSVLAKNLATLSEP